MSVDLLSCPFCGSGEIIMPDKSPFYYLDCNASGPEDDWVPGVTWNTRAPDPAVAVLEAEVARLRTGLARIWADDYPRAGMSKGQCHHNRYAHEVCEECIWEYAHSVLNPAPSEKEAG